MEKSNQRSSSPNESVKVMCMGNNYDSPCTFPFALKVQTYLRMTDIQHEVVSCVLPSSKRNVPYIEYNGNQIDDPTAIIEFLNKEFGKDLKSNLSAEEDETTMKYKSLVEDHLYWEVEYQRWMMDESIADIFPLTNWFMRFIFKAMLRCKLKKELEADLKKQGLNNYSQEEIIQKAEKDLKQLSDYLDDKPFFMGKEASEIDASVFAVLATLLHGLEQWPCAQYTKTNLPNLVAYVERMKEKYWPDWDEKCSPRKTKDSGAGACGKQEGSCVGKSSSIPTCSAE